MPNPYSENLLIQKSTAELLEKELNWRISVYSFDNEDTDKSGILGRKAQNEGVLTRHLRMALKRLNTWMNDTVDTRTYCLIDIPARLDFVQDAGKIKESDIERVKTNMSKICPRYVQNMSMNEIGYLAICLLRARKEISAQDMLDGIDKISYKQKKRKYLDKLLEIGAVSMTIPDKPTSKNQKYFLSDLGQDIIHKQ